MPVNNPPIDKPYKLPSQYKFIKVLGEGDYGEVIKCWKKDSKHTVAIKIPKGYDEETQNEVLLLKKFMRLKLDQQNIVKFIDCFDTKFGKAIVFEALDISLKNYLKKINSAPMLLSDVRTIVQQLATALAALKKVDVIHTDIKLDNIMMVNHRLRPYKVKLIDFGLAILKSFACFFEKVQPLRYRAPEVILGLPFSGAIDMWSLGIVMAEMVCGKVLFPGPSEYEVLRCVVELLDLPAHHLLNEGSRTRRFFTPTGSGNWTLKTPEEFYTRPPARRPKGYDFKCLDELKTLRLERKNKDEAVEREHCIELLKAMLTTDPKKRITPKKVLAHPFITKAGLNRNAAKGVTKKDANKINTRPVTEVARKQESVTRTASQLPLIDRPVTTVHSQQMDSDRESFQSCASETTQSVTSANEDFECELPTDPPEDEEDNIVQPNCSCSPSRASLASGVIVVRPATAENTLQLEDIEDEENTIIHPDCCSPSHSSPPSGVIAVQPVTAENTLQLEDIEDEDSTIMHPNYCSPSHTSPPSGVIAVRPAAAENILQSEDQDNAVSHQSGLDKPSESSVKDSKASISTDSTTCDDTRRKKKKKKNCFQRVISWVRKTFGPHRIDIVNDA